MKTGWVLSLTVALLAGGLLTPPLGALKPEVRQVGLDTPFTLRPGEMARVGPAGFEVTLRTLADDSGCLAPNDCSLMLFKGTLVLSLGDKRNLTQLDADLRPDQPANLDFAGYKLRVTAVHRVKGRLEAVFKLVEAEGKK
ncbi:MAG TPA: hypothetical protein VF173_21040 [Thermoanaerobaculia bacterium]|nr:hypothetical protein [Thermoanaerobaculia bacterium]